MGTSALGTSCRAVALVHVLGFHRGVCGGTRAIRSKPERSEGKSRALDTIVVPMPHHDLPVTSEQPTAAGPANPTTAAHTLKRPVRERARVATYGSS